MAEVELIKNAGEWPYPTLVFVGLIIIISILIRTHSKERQKKDDLIAKLIEKKD